MNDATKNLILDIRTINAMRSYVPAIAKLQMIMARVDWFEAHRLGDWERANEAYNALHVLMDEWVLRISDPTPAITTDDNNDNQPIKQIQLMGENRHDYSND